MFYLAKNKYYFNFEAKQEISTKTRLASQRQFEKSPPEVI